MKKPVLYVLGFLGISAPIAAIAVPGLASG